MDNSNDDEFLPNPEALASFRDGTDTNTRPLGRAFWEKLDLSEDKATDLTSRLKQEEAVTQFVKNDLEQKLQSFGILYASTFFFVMGMIFLLSHISDSRLDWRCTSRFVRVYKVGT